MLPLSQKVQLRQFFRAWPVLRVWVFGSVARGEAKENSDIDLLVELDHSQFVGLDFIEMRFALEELLEKKVDLVSTRGLSPWVAPHIEKDKILIYAR
jgi:predicted nucleotidyltransferase